MGKAMRRARVLYDTTVATVAKDLDMTPADVLDVEAGRFRASDRMLAYYDKNFRLAVGEMKDVKDR